MSFIRPLALLTLLLSVPLPFVAGCTGSVDVPDEDVARPGRPAAAPCAFDTQCATQRCSADVEAGTCGECVTIEALGHDCTGPHQGCSISAVCKDGVCQSLRKVEGEACSLGPKGDDLSECDVELYCARTGDWGEPGTCVPLIPVGKTCGDGYGRCVSGAVCNRADVCAVPVPGSCDGTWQCDAGFHCGDDLWCYPATLPQDAACGIVDGSFVDNECGPGLVCGNAEYPNGGSTDTMCVPLPGKGEPCIRDACGEGLFCFRPLEDYTQSYCDVPRGEGEECRNDNLFGVPCAAGLECRANTCRIACE